MRRAFAARLTGFIAAALVALSATIAPAVAVEFLVGPASATAGGNVTTGAQTFAGPKTFTSDVTLSAGKYIGSSVGNRILFNSTAVFLTSSTSTTLDIDSGATTTTSAVNVRTNGGALQVASIREDGLLDTIGTIRATGQTSPTAGTGAEVSYTGAGYFRTYDRTGSAYAVTHVQGSSVTLDPAGTVGLTASSTGVDVVNDLAVTTAGKGLKIKEGSNARMGTATLVAGSSVVSNTSVTANSRIFLTSNTDGGTPGWLRVSARTASTSFTITSSSGTDTSTVAWVILEPAP